MTVAILSDSPTVTTGFGLTTSHMASALARAGHNVECFGIKAQAGDADGCDLAYRVWPAQRGGHWARTLPAFFRTVRPRVLVLNMDAYNAVECLDLCRAAGWDGPVVSYVCFDGLPVARLHLEAQRSCAAVWATSHTGAEYLRDNGVTVTGVAPPGVDQRVFRPAPDAAALRARAGLSGATVVGVFATNTERKQVARTVVGFAGAVTKLPELDLRLYLHCRRDGFWRLDDLAAQHGVADRMLFPTAGAFDERRGVPTTNERDDSTDIVPTGSGRLPNGFSYVDRLNCCDVLVNVPHSGDVEQVILEGQACGVPVINTNDDGIMAEALGHGGISVPAAEIGYGRNGELLHHVDPDAIARALVRLLSDPVAQARLIQAGLENSALYSWRVLESATCIMVERFVLPGDQ